MKDKKGISLIVLVITIIVMIILAGTIILSLSNTDIFKKAEQAVEDTNLQEIRQIAALEWSEAYLKGKGKYSETDLYKLVMAGLNEQNLDLRPYEIIVTANGVTVEKIPTIADMEQAHTFEYYSSLSDAVDAVNGDETVVSVKKENAVAGIYTEDGAITVVLLKDTTETERIILECDMTINLGGNTLTFNTHLGFTGAKDHTDTITIDGRLDGSTIIINGSGIGARAIQTRTDTFIINGGTYYANMDVEPTEEATISVAQTSGRLIMNNCKAYASAIIANNSQYVINVHTITSNVTAEKINLKNCVIESKLAKGALKGNIFGVESHCDTELTNCIIKSYSDYSDEIKSGGVYSEQQDGNLKLIDCDVMGIRHGVFSQGNLYVDGGTYEGYIDGGMNLAGNGLEKIYVKNATISACQMPEGYVDAETNYGAKSINIGDDAASDNMKIYIDNCTLTHDVTFNGYLGANKNTLYISNSIINGKIRIDNDMNKLYIGKGNTSKGNKFDISNVEIPSGVDLEKVVEETNEVYVK